MTARQSVAAMPAQKSAVIQLKIARAALLMQRAVAQWKNMAANVEREDYVRDLQAHLKVALAAGDERALRAILRKSVAGLGQPRCVQGQIT